MLYFDHNATHPLSRVAREAWLDAVERYPANPSSPHRLGARADAAIQQAREKLAAWMGCEPLEIVWTAGATEANNMAVHHLAGRFGELWLTAIEHPAVLVAARSRFAGRLRVLPVVDGRIDGAWLRAELDRAEPAGIAVMAANNETGALQPWAELAALCRAREVPFLCDAAQWIGKMPARGLGACDLVSGCAHKFGGPPGVGFLKCPTDLRPMLVGGPQEEGRRAGTENVAGILAMVATLEERERGLADAVDCTRRLAWRDDFEHELLAALPGAAIVAEGADRLWNTSTVIMPEVPDCRQRWVVKFDKLGFAVSTGSACASGKEQPSHVMTAMGYTPEQAGRVLRFTSGWDTTVDDWRALLDGAVQAARELAEAARVSS